MSKKKARKTKESRPEVKSQARRPVKPVATTTEEKVAGFRADSQAARMYRLLEDAGEEGLTFEQIHKAIPDTTLSHVKNGLLYALRKRGYETGEFHVVNEDHKLRLVKGAKPAKEKKAKAKAAPKGKAVSSKEAKAESVS